MEAESAVTAIFSAQLQEIREKGLDPGPELTTEMDRIRAEYEEELDARFAAARGFVDGILLPEELREGLGLLLRASMNNPGPHIGPFQLQDE